jgi:glycosyltransferase involved in cell wall biosynthesis
LTDLTSFPLVTIVIPTYNRKELLQKAIASILSQTYVNWELFIVDDGSVDDTGELVLSIKDARIHLINLNHVGNIAGLRNIGAAAGSGKWIAFLDSDDEWTAGKLEKQIRLLQQENKLWSYGGYELINQASQTIPDKYGIFRPISGWITTQLLTCEAAVNIGSLMVHRDLFNEIRGFNSEPKLLYREDYELALRLSLLAEALAVPDLLVRVREHTGRSTNTIDDGYERTAFVYRHFLNLKKGDEYERTARRRMAYHLTEMSVDFMQRRMYLKAVSQLAKAFVNRDKLRHLFSAMYRGLRTGNG